MYAAMLLTVLADAGKSVRYLAGRAVWQASAVYRGGEANADATDARVIADQARMRGDHLPLMHPHDDLMPVKKILTSQQSDRGHCGITAVFQDPSMTMRRQYLQLVNTGAVAQLVRAADS